MVLDRIETLEAKLRDVMSLEPIRKALAKRDEEAAKAQEESRAAAEKSSAEAKEKSDAPPKNPR